MQKILRNKLLIIGIVIVLAGLFLFAYNSFFAPEGVNGEKTITIRIIIEKQNINERSSYNTEHKFLYDLLKEKDELRVSFREYDFGAMLVGLMDYRAEERNSEFFHISINGEDALEGLQEIVLNDGDLYTIELKAW